jgi:hypothetical protein
MAIPSPLDEIATITVRLYGSGQMGIEGNLGDVRLATQMLDHARDAVVAQWARRNPAGGLIIPGCDVEVQHHPEFPVMAAGDR